jgi:bifunctional non-homologous end joining protein LigD
MSSHYPEVQRQHPRREAARAVEVCGVRITHADRVMFGDLALTKEQLARYYVAVGPAMVPHVRDRPLTLVRCPQGAGAPCLYMRHLRAWGPPALRRVSIREKTKIGEYLVADSIEALVSLVQMDTIEVHTWCARAEQLERPDLVVFDLDPGPDVPWSRVVGAAHLVRQVLARLDLVSYPKTTGGKGLHVVVPLQPRSGWDECLGFARAVAHALAHTQPDAFTASMVKSARAGRVYVDYLRNHRAASSVSPYSTRVRPHAPVAVPVTWDEVTAELRPDAFTVATVPDRLRALRRDPWAGWEHARQRLRATMLRSIDGAVATQR